MAKSPKNESESELWVRPRSSLKGPDGERAWDKHLGGIPNSSRFLELADIALGVKKPTPKKKRTVVHDKTKKEPYSS